MDAREALVAFEGLLASRGLTTDDLDAVTAVDAMLEFYLGTRFGDVDSDEDGDMLLFEWGTFNAGSSFYYEMTRQLITNGSCDDDAFSQLSLTLKYDADADAQTIRSSCRWCMRPVEESLDGAPSQDGEEDVARFREFIRNSAATDYVRGRKPREVTLTFGGV
jgi:hypothetical protein